MARMGDSWMNRREDSDQLRQRRENLEKLRALDVQPYPHRFEASGTVAAIAAEHAGRSGEDLENARPEAATAGRIVAIRSFGKARFLVLSDGKARLQAYVRKDSVSARDFEVVKLLDVGDVVGVAGRIFRTRTDELTVWAARVEFLAKCHVPLPEKWHGLKDVEIRYRQRYLDLIVNHPSREVFEVRGARDPRHPGVSRRARLPRGRDADDAAARRRCARAGRSSRTTTRSTCRCTCASRRSCT